MNKGFRALGIAATVAAAMLVLAAPLMAQFGGSTGNIYGTVQDEQGGVLPGVSVTVTGMGAPQTQTTDAKGQYRFISLAPGKYTVVLALTGFSSETLDGVTVQVGKNTELTSKLKLSAVAASITVTSEAPVIDTRKVETGAAITNAELQDIPTARDPWVVLQTVPGIQIDRINVAGSESGQQSNFASKGSAAGSFTVDGVNLTDMSALGASAGYYDFDSFQEMNVVTGGADPSMQGSGAHLSMVTKRGTNEVHGSARFFVVDDKLESTNLTPIVAAQIGAGNKIDSLQDYGVEAGGPVVKDIAWLWGAYGRDQIDLSTAGGTPAGTKDKTTLEDFNAKLNLQLIPSNAFNSWYLGSNKLKFGRSAGSTRPQATSWDQNTPAHIWKFEDSQVFSSNLFATASYSGNNNDFSLTPEGGNAALYIDADGVWHNSYLYFDGPRPTRQAKIDTSFFFNTGDLGHELKAGFSYLNAQARSTTSWPLVNPPSTSTLTAQTYGDFFDCGVPCAAITRNSAFKVENKYYSAYFGDTLTWNRLTVNLGVRWDQQYGANSPSLVPENVSFPGIMPAINYPGSGTQFKWNDWQPRIGVNYALGQNRNTVLKASYAQFADALGTATVATTNPIAGPSYAYYAWNDANGNNLVDVGEVDTSSAGFQYGRNYNQASPGTAGSTSGIDPNLNAPSTKEFIVGVDQEVAANFAIGVNYTNRKATNQLYAPLHVYDPTTGTILNSGDYEQYTTLTGFTPSGTAYSQPVYQVKPSVLNALGYCTDYGAADQSCSALSGSYTFNRGGFDTTYQGIELVMTKRLSDKWMARGSFVWNDNKQNVGAGGCIDPTNQLAGAANNSGGASTVNAQTCRDNDYVAIQSTGSGNKSSVFLNSTWQFAFNALYQLPYNFNISTNVFGRQGFPINWYLNSTSDGATGDGLTRNVVVVPAGSDRYKDVYEWDLQVGYVVKIFGTGTMTLTGSCFNVLNSATVLQRFNRLERSNTGQIKEIQSPRVARFGVQISF